MTFIVSNWKPHSSHTLQAYFSLTLPSGMTLHGWSFHVKDEKRWVSPPAKEYPKNIWSPLIEIADEQKRAKFQEQAVAAVDAWLEAQG